MNNFSAIFIYIAFLGVGLNASSWAGQIAEKYNSPAVELAAELQLGNGVELLASEPNPPTNRNNKSWSWLGIIGTSALFLFVLFHLFQEEKEQIDRSEKSKVISDREEVNSVAEVESIEPKRLAGKSAFPMIGMSYDEEFNYEPILNPATVNGEIVRTTRSEITITEVTEEIAGKENPAVDSDITGKLTVVTSAATEIDVVFELIQDLQYDRELENPQEKQKLRRKAIWELGQTHDFRAVEPLVQTISQVDSLEKSLILNAITQIAERNLETIERVLLDSLEDDNAEVRNNAIQDLMTLYQSVSSVIARLSEMSKDENEEVGETAKWALAQFDRMVLPIASVEYIETERDLASSKSKLN